MTEIKKLHIFALAAQGEGISGGDRIFIELSRRWSNKFPITIYVTNDGYEMCTRQKLVSNKNLKFTIVELGVLGRFGFLGNYISRIVAGIKLGISILPTTNYPPPNTFLYNASEFWMDSLPCIVLKIKFPKIKWIATWFQTAPSPFSGYTEQRTNGNEQRSNKYRMSALLYWLSQLPIKPLISRLADKVIVNNEDEKRRFPTHTANNNTIVLIGAVPLKEIKNYLTTHHPLPNPKYDAVFQGRFHPQKGVLELIDIWKMVVMIKPKAKLAMIGDGPLMNDVKSQITNHKLQKNIELFGYVFDGEVKFKVFAESKIVVHPAFYDSGGMAAAEAMAFGLPCVGFNLKAYESYYPKGMIKVEIGNKKKFAEKILKLITNSQYYREISEEASDMIKENWSWETRSEEILSSIKS